MGITPPDLEEDPCNLLELAFAQIIRTSCLCFKKLEAETTVGKDMDDI